MPVVDVEYETENNHSPVQAIVTALADAADIDPVDLPPISEHVDPAALNALFDPHDRTTDGDTVLSFQVDPGTYSSAPTASSASVTRHSEPIWSRFCIYQHLTRLLFERGR
ncbi:HalOD1 output domain-containing protein [Halomicroarcula sp. GCM10025324]|uniref:HalOD1 output domain-containing protein n=1 Tax=Haloarcula TaxID=2237 RepID=UPI00361404B3